MRLQPAFFFLATSLVSGIQASSNSYYGTADSDLQFITELGKRWLEARTPHGHGHGHPHPNGAQSPFGGPRAAYYPFRPGPKGIRLPQRPRYGIPPHGNGMMYAGGTPGFYSKGGAGGVRARKVADDGDDSYVEEVQRRNLPEPTQIQFQIAMNLVKSLKVNLTESERISLYGLYQQATLGDINEEKEKAKLEAWKSRSSLSKDEAKKKFSSLAHSLYKDITAPTTTTTPTKSAVVHTIVMTQVPTVAPSTKHLWNMYSPPQNFNEPEFVKYNKKAEELHEKFSEDEKMKLFGLYKQSILGDNRVQRVEDAGKELGGYKPKERWEKWESFKGKSKDDARKEYIAFVKELEGKYKDRK